MKVELTKKEIKVILDLMESGVTFLITHGQSEFRGESSKSEDVVNIDELESKLRDYLVDDVIIPSTCTEEVKDDTF